MKHFIKPALVASVIASSAFSIGCMPVEEESATVDWSITPENAENIVANVLAFNKTTDQVNDSNTSSDSADNLRTIETRVISGPVTLNCAVGGNVSITTDAELFAPLYVTATLNNCDNGDGPATGSLDATIVIANPVTASFDLALTAKNATINGSLVMTREVAFGGMYTYDLDGSLTTADGTLTVADEPAFTGYGMNPPVSGVRLITGPNGGHIRVTANGGYAYIDIDADRDGIFEYLGNGIPWSDLEQ